MSGKKILFSCLGVLLWVAIWWIVAAMLGDPLLVPTPFAVLLRLGGLCGRAEFWLSLTISIGRILLGFACGILFGTVLALVSRSFIGERLLAPLRVIIKATPVASFIMLCWLWLKRGQIPSFIAALIVIPVVWNNISLGLDCVTDEMKQFALMYGLSVKKKIRYLYLPAVLPSFAAAVDAGTGLVWKAGVAAEVLCQPTYSIGAQLFRAKNLLETTDVFAWTAVIIIISLVLEYGIRRLLALWKKHLAGRGMNGPAEKRQRNT